MTYSIQTETGHVFLTATNIEDARVWVASQLGLPPGAFRLTDREIINGIAKHFNGGWGAFSAWTNAMDNLPNLLGAYRSKYNY